MGVTDYPGANGIELEWREYVNPIKKVRKKACFRRKTSLFASQTGGDKRDRTADLLNAIQALSQLSYTPGLRCSTVFYAELLERRYFFVEFRGKSVGAFLTIHAPS